MKNLLALFVIFFVFPYYGFSQDIDYYASVLDTTKSTQLKLTFLDSLISKTFRKDDDAFIEYSIQYIDLAKDVDSIEAAARKAMNLQFIITSRKNKPEKAVSIINGVLAHKYKIDDSFLLGGLYLKRGRANFRIDLKKAIADYSLALENFSPRDSVYLADTYLFKGQAYSNLGQFVPAGENYQKAYDYYEALKDYTYMVHAQQGITTMFSMNSFYDKAKEERGKIIEKLKNLNLNNFLVVEYYNQALDDKKMGNKKLHLENLNEAVTILNKTPDEDRDFSQSIMVHSKLIEYYANENDIENATKHITLVSEWIKNTEDINSKLNYYGAIAKFHYALGDYDTALIHAKKKLEGSRSYSYTDAILDSYDLLADIYAKKGDYKRSLEHKQAYITLNDSIYNPNSSNVLAYYQTLYETEKKEKELVEKNSNIQLLEKDNEAFKKVVAFSSVALILFFGMILLFRNQQNLKNNKMLQEKFSQKLLVSQEEERKRISKDLHDGLGQQLLLIKNKVVANGDEATKKMVDTAIEEVRTISRDLHPFQLQEMGITKAIQHSLTQIDENTTLFISSEIDNIDNLFSPEQEVNIYRIVQESLNNILKHAKAEASKVSVKKFANNIVISIKDNGDGFDFSEKYQDIKSLGLKTLLERTKFLNGQMKVQSKINNGTTLEFQFPV
ncbi:histidine kinase/DNA gyrase B/HSP90-like ATPase [Ulvibacter sp. MAR_2010_11]|uniref:tetratricopeptide repeat-containing sensor histidine kinase n=1 Tax=Ulvibacter sp. MAR_2010_11 TaxID=1250229 RepID=UPI000C2BD06E|nr:sensor histidine kinase [Ulvibacter sp. MAR_2010_11]PKA83180.1 histidine kinase/DNA gyrase B/HSP90-like ATPase [Ulvibacter sp. MAR_2010_11]